MQRVTQASRLCSSRSTAGTAVTVRCCLRRPAGTNRNFCAYSRVANSDLVGQIDFKRDANTVMTATKTRDNLNRLTSVAHGAWKPASAYNYNAAGQRDRLEHHVSPPQDFFLDAQALPSTRRGPRHASSACFPEPGACAPGAQQLGRGAPALKSGASLLEKCLLPLVEERRMDVMLIARLSGCGKEI
jgi:hypothetical protein